MAADASADGARGDTRLTEGELTPREVGGFRILRRLASGATSDVLLARAEGPHGFQRVVALKILFARKQGNPDFERTFGAAASAYARLSHPAVVKLYDFFSAEGQLVMVLEFVDGLPLHKLRAMLAITGERIEDKAALYLGLRIFSALAAAHGARDPMKGELAPVIHQDVNPSNVLVPWDGQVKLGDFGIAKAAGVEADARSGFIKGTYGYSAPEQVTGKEVTPRADVYSAGMILWELLARRKAVQRGGLNDAQVQKAMAHPEFPALELLRPDLDAAVRAAIRRTLEPDPEKRTITAEEVVNVLRQAVSAEEGRKALALAVTRVRSGTGADGPASVRSAATDVDASGPDSVTEVAIDLGKTAQYSAALEDGGDLGKIAFYGRLNLPAESSPPPKPEPRRRLRRCPRPSPRLLCPGRRSRPPCRRPRRRRSSRWCRRVRRARRHGCRSRRRISAFPTVPAPALEPETLGGGGARGRARPRPRPGARASGDRRTAPSHPTPEDAVGAPSAVRRRGRAPVQRSRNGGLRACTHAHRPSERAPLRGVLAPPSPRRAAAAAEHLPLGSGRDRGSPAGRRRGLLLPAGGTAAQRSPAPVVVVVKPPAAHPAPSAPPSSILPPLLLPPRAGPPRHLRQPRPSPPLPRRPSLPAPRSPRSPRPRQRLRRRHRSRFRCRRVVGCVTGRIAGSPACVGRGGTAPPTPALAADMGELVLPASAAGHRIFVDGKVVSEGKAPLQLHCGTHAVHIGSAGAEKGIAVPCGASIKF